MYIPLSKCFCGFALHDDVLMLIYIIYICAMHLSVLWSSKLKMNETCGCGFAFDISSYDDVR